MGNISRQHGRGKKGQSSRTRSALNTGFEVRRIVVARGLQRNHADQKRHLANWERRLASAKTNSDRKKANKNITYYRNCLVPDDKGMLVGKVKLEDRGAGADFRWEYRNKHQKVKYLIKVVEAKHEFKKWLGTRDVHVIYTGHSRYGRGACFGPDESDGDQWEDGTGCLIGRIGKVDGLFRLGYDVVGIPIEDIYHHGYHTRPVQGPKPRDATGWHRTISKKFKAGRLREVVFDSRLDTGKIGAEGIYSRTEGWGSWIFDPEDPKKRIRIKPKFNLKERFYDNHDRGPFWGFIQQNRTNGPWTLHLALHAGWKHTATDPWELDDVNPMQCKVFCHLGCSSKKHYRTIVRSKKGYRLKGEKRSTRYYSYFTSSPSYGVSAPVYLSKLLTIKKLSKGRAWGPLLKDARKAASKELGKMGYKFSIVP
jgi:hypothetical protein